MHLIWMQHYFMVEGKHHEILCYLVYETETKKCLWQNDVFLGFELTEDEHGNRQYEIIFSVVLVTLMFKHV